MTAGPDRPSVLVNLLWCVPGAVGGSEEYLVRQLYGLTQQPAPQWNPTVAMAKGLKAAHPSLADRLPIKEAPFSSEHRARRILGESTWLRRLERGAALVHHGGGTAPFTTRRPYVLTLHDLQFLTYPDYFSRLKRAYLSTVIPRSVRRAAVVAVPTEFVRDSVIDEYGADPAAVMVVPNGIEPAVSTDVTPPNVLRGRYDLGSGPIVVYPAVTHPHKNHAFLLKLLAGPWSDPDLRLVLCGGVGAAEGDVAATSDPRVRRIGRVPDADRNGLLAMADAMVFPSRYEGFGAPLVEAMALGAPVVCSDAACIPEVVGDAAVVRPLRLDAWADALVDVRERRDELVTAGHLRAAGFTSEVSGAALAAVYERAVGL